MFTHPKLGHRLAEIVQIFQSSHGTLGSSYCRVRAQVQYTGTRYVRTYV